MYLNAHFTESFPAFLYSDYSSIPDIKGGTRKGSMMPETDRLTLEGENVIFYMTVIIGVTPPFTSPF